MSVMELHEMLAAAQKAVEEAGVADDLREVAFEKALEILTTGGIVAGEGRMLSGAGQAISPDDSQGSSSPPSLVQRLASRLGVSEIEAGEIFFERDGDLDVTAPSSRLDSSKKGGTEQLALLLASGRQAAGLEEWTHSSRIREVCNFYGKFDSNNFAYTLSKMDDVFQIRGRGQDREVRVKLPGFERAAELVRELTTRNG